MEGRDRIYPAELDHLRFEPGSLRYTDDTHMTIGMAESLLAKRGFDGSHMAMTFARNYAREPWRGRTNLRNSAGLASTRQSLSRYPLRVTPFRDDLFHLLYPFRQ